MLRKVSRYVNTTGGGDALRINGSPGGADD